MRCWGIARIAVHLVCVVAGPPARCSLPFSRRHDERVLAKGGVLLIFLPLKDEVSLAVRTRLLGAALLFQR